MPNNPPRYQDGFFGVPVRVSQRPRTYPFRGSGDTTTAVYTASYVVDLASWTPTPAGTVDPENAGFYLVDESRPTVLQGALAEFTRTYANVPLQQIAATTISVNRPNPSAVYGAGTNIIRDNSGTTLGPATYYLGYVWAASKVFTQVTSYYSGSYVVVGTATWDFYTVTAHGFNPAAALAISVLVGSGSPVVTAPLSTLLQPVTDWYVQDANTIAVRNTAYTGTNCNAIGQAIRAYTIGQGIIGGRTQQDFYLPGVTAGIATYADIPTVPSLLLDTDFLAAVVANPTGYVTYQLRSLGLWQGSIYQRTLDQLNFAAL